MSTSEIKIKEKVIERSTKSLAETIRVIESEIVDVEIALQGKRGRIEKSGLSEFRNLLATELALIKSSLDVLRNEEPLLNYLLAEEV